MSSSWRIGVTIDYIRDLFKEVGIVAEVIDFTPDLLDTTRGKEIEQWLNNNLVNKYVIIDDGNDMTPEQQSHFFLTQTKKRVD